MNLDFFGKPGEFIAILASAGIILIAIASLAGFLGRWAWQLDLFSHFRVQYSLLLSGLTPITLFWGSRDISYLGLGFLLLNLMTILPIYFPLRMKKEGSNTSRILLSNVLRPNEKYEKLAKVIHETSPDIIVLIEISDLWLQALDPELIKYAHCYIAKRSDNYGIAMFSNYAIKEVQIKYFSGANVPSLVATLEIDGCAFTLLATHPPPPKTRLESLYRNQQLKNIADFAAAQPKPCMLLGDLNLTSWSPYFQELTNRSGLHDSRKGFGIQPTWPVDKPIFLVPVDHMLVSDDIIIHNRFTGQAIGSDHLPVIVDFSLDIESEKANHMV